MKDSFLRTLNGSEGFFNQLLPGLGQHLRDNPFGASPVGGETPFFTGPTEAAASFEDDTEGIPLGLPGLLDLPDVPDPPAVPTTAAAPAADDDFEPATPAPAPRISRDPAVETQEALKHFLIGLAVASVAWFLVIGGWMFLLPR